MELLMRQRLGRAMRGIWGLAAQPGSQAPHACVCVPPLSSPAPGTTVAKPQEVKSWFQGPGRAGETQSTSVLPTPPNKSPKSLPSSFLNSVSLGKKTQTFPR